MSFAKIIKKLMIAINPGFFIILCDTKFRNYGQICLDRCTIEVSETLAHCQPTAKTLNESCAPTSRNEADKT